MHDQLLNAEVANLQRAQFERESRRRHTVDRDPKVRKAVSLGVLGRVGQLVQRHRRLKPALHH
jgi:hypothetical protein